MRHVSITHIFSATSLSLFHLTLLSPINILLPSYLQRLTKQDQGTWLLLLGYSICLPLIWGITAVRASYRRLETKAKLKQGLSTNTGTRWQGGDPITLITQRSPLRAARDTGTNTGKQIHTQAQQHASIEMHVDMLASASQWIKRAALPHSCGQQVYPLSWLLVLAVQAGVESR